MDVPVMTTQQFFKPGEHFHMQVSTDFPDFVGVAHRHEYIEVVYVLSGAATPIRYSAFFKMPRQARVTARRAAVSPASSDRMRCS